MNVLSSDGEIAGAGPVGEDAQIDVLEAAMLHRQAAAPDWNWVPAQIAIWVLRKVMPSK